MSKTLVHHGVLDSCEVFLLQISACISFVFVIMFVTKRDLFTHLRYIINCNFVLQYSL